MHCGRQQGRGLGHPLSVSLLSSDLEGWEKRVRTRLWCWRLWYDLYSAASWITRETRSAREGKGRLGPDKESRDE